MLGKKEVMGCGGLYWGRRAALGCIAVPSIPAPLGRGGSLQRDPKWN